MKRHLAFFLSLLLGAGSAFAQTGETINQLSPGAGLAGTEQIPMYQGSNPAVTTTPSALATYVFGGSPRSGQNDWVNIKDPRFVQPATAAPTIRRPSRRRSTMLSPTI